MGDVVEQELRIDELMESINEMYSKYVIPLFGEKDEDTKVTSTFLILRTLFLLYLST